MQEVPDSRFPAWPVRTVIENWDWLSPRYRVRLAGALCLAVGVVMLISS